MKNPPRNALLEERGREWPLVILAISDDRKNKASSAMPMHIERP